MREHLELAIASRTLLAEALSGRGLRPVTSQANFLFLPIPRAGVLARTMRERGVAVRPFENLPAVSEALAATKGSALRITVGPPDTMAEALVVLDEARRACA
jgi:histidinol-phosphate aminotransferase